VTEPSRGDNEALLEIYEAAFRSYQRSVEFLDSLFRNGHQKEAVLLCCCYIDGLAGLRWPRERSRRRFQRALEEYGEDETLSCIYPRHLRKALQRRRPKKVKVIGRKLDHLLANAGNKLYTRAQMLALAARELEPEERQIFEDNLWRSTLGAIAYERMRCPLVHELSGTTAIWLDQATFRGFPVPDVEFTALYKAVRALLPVAKDHFFSSCGAG
jgi:hypothetical protein